MGLLDDLERRNRKKGFARRRTVRIDTRQLPPAPFGTHWVTPQQAARERKQLARQVAGLVIGGIGWSVAAILWSSFGVLGIVPGLVVGVLFTVLAVVVAFSQSDKELKRHAWKAWREFKSLLKK